MNSSLVLERIRKSLKLNKEGPAILRPEFLGEPYKLFSDTYIKNLLKDVYTKQSNIETATALAYISFIENRTSKAFIKSRLDLAKVSTTLIRSFTESFHTLVGTELTRKRFNLFSMGTRYSKIDVNYNKETNTIDMPKITIIQLLMAKKGNLDVTLAQLVGYAFREVPESIKKGNLQTSALKNMPVYQWTFLCSVNGVTIYIARVNTNMLAMRMDTSIPFILPLRTLTVGTLTNKIGNYIERMSMGVR